MRAAGQRKERPHIGRFQLFHEYIHIKPGKQMQRRADFAIDRMLHRHINDRAALVDDRVQLVRRMRLVVRAGQRALVVCGFAFAGLFQNIAARGGQDTQPAGAHDCNVPYNDLPAHGEAGCNIARAQRAIRCAQQVFYFLTSFGCIH